MENEIEKIIEVVSSVFAGADERDWKKVTQAMAPEVLLDYTSMAGGSPAVLTSQQIADSWAAFLPGFDKTHHQLSDFKVSLHPDCALATYFGKADHYIDEKFWTVEGTYETELKQQGEQWYVTKHKFNLTSQSGNTSLPAEATARMAK